MAAYYNELDPYAAAWLRNLIAEGIIAPGEVDERDIRDVTAADLAGFTQCHFFAGIGVWSLALRRAGWPDGRAVWTGSCPCQPFSAAGRRGGAADERHLWPHWFHLIEICRPPVVFGEQVASKDGLGWLDLVSADLEGAGYATGAADLCAAGVGAPHIRQRLWFVAEGVEHPKGDGREEWRTEPSGRRAISGRSTISVADAGGEGLEGGDQGAMGHERQAVERGGSAGGLENSDRERREGVGLQLQLQPGAPRQAVLEVAGRGEAGGLADADREDQSGRGVQRPGEGAGEGAGAALQRSEGLRQDHHRGPTNGYWGAADWLGCRDGKWRPVEPGTFPLAHGAPARVGRLRAYGNAIVAPVAEAFVTAYLETRP